MASEIRNTTLMMPKVRALSPKMRRRSDVSVSRALISVPLPWPDPGPARAAEEGSDGGQHHQLAEEPGHDPERDRLRHQPTAEAIGWIRRSQRSDHHEDRHHNRRRQRDENVEVNQKNRERNHD